MKYHLFRFKKFLRELFTYPVSHLSLESVDYDAYWEDKRGPTVGKLSPWQKQRADLVVRCLNGEKEPVSIVDIGGGDGCIPHYLRDKLPLGTVTVVDVSDVVLSKARADGFETVMTDITTHEGRMKIPEADFIFMFEILEHIPDPEAFLALMKSKARKGVLFSFPNTGFISYRLRLLLGRFPLQWRLHPGEHLRFWTLTDLRWWLKALGYTQYHLYTYEGVPVLKKVWPALFAAASFVYLESENHT